MENEILHEGYTFLLRRRAADITQEEAATILGVSISTIVDYEKARFDGGKQFHAAIETLFVTKQKESTNVQ